VILGYNTNGFASHRLLDAIEIIAEIGYQAVAISVDHHALDPFGTHLAAEQRAVAATLRRTGLSCVIETGARFLLDPRHKHQPTLLSKPADERERRIDFLCRCADIASELEADVLSLWSGAPAEDEPQGPALLDERLREGLMRVCDHAATRGVVVAFEPEPGMHIESMADFERLGFEHPAFALTLDLGHAHLTESSVEDTLGRYRGRIVNVHVDGMRRPVHDHLAPWDSEFDVRAALAQLRALGYSGPATLELSRHSHAAVDTARRAFEFLSAF
jgi:sugar phosphate isomerase/epimerase